MDRRAASRSCLGERELLAILEPGMLFEPDNDDHDNGDQNGEYASTDEHAIPVASAFVCLPFKP